MQYITTPSYHRGGNRFRPGVSSSRSDDIAFSFLVPQWHRGSTGVRVYPSALIAAGGGKRKSGGRQIVRSSSLHVTPQDPDRSVDAEDTGEGAGVELRIDHIGRTDGLQNPLAPAEGPWSGASGKRKETKGQWAVPLGRSRSTISGELPRPKG